MKTLIDKDLPFLIVRTRQRRSQTAINLRRKIYPQTMKEGSPLTNKVCNEVLDVWLDIVRNVGKVLSNTAVSVITYIEFWLLKYFQQGYTAVGVMQESMVVLLTGGQTPLHGSRRDSYYSYIQDQLQYIELDLYHLTRRSSLGCSPKGFYCILFLPGLFQDRMVRGWWRKGKVCYKRRG